MDYGFMLNGFTIVEACEFNPKYTYCYSEALGSKLGYEFQLNESTDLSNKTVRDDLVKRYQGVEGIVGGPPCQDFSIAGKNNGVKGKNGSQVLNYLDIVKRIKPDFLFFENVKGLYSTMKHRPTLDYLISELKICGYNVNFKIINSIEYGVPQYRERIFIIAFLETKYKQEFKWPKKTHENFYKVEWPKPWEFNNELSIDIKMPKKYHELTVKFALEGSSDLPNANEVFTPKSKKFVEIMEGDVYRQSFKRLHRYKYSPTVAYGNNEVHLHPTEARRLSVRESLRLQSVPDSYIMPNDLDLTAKFKMISNGVPTKLSSLFARSILKHLNEVE